MENVKKEVLTYPVRCFVIPRPLGVKSEVKDSLQAIGHPMGGELRADAKLSQSRKATHWVANRARKSTYRVEN
jgi:hypothetical protein